MMKFVSLSMLLITISTHQVEGSGSGGGTPVSMVLAGKAMSSALATVEEMALGRAKILKEASRTVEETKVDEAGDSATASARPAVADKELKEYIPNPSQNKKVLLGDMVKFPGWIVLEKKAISKNGGWLCALHDPETSTKYITANRPGFCYKSLHEKGEGIKNITCVKKEFENGEQVLVMAPYETMEYMEEKSSRNLYPYAKGTVTKVRKTDKGVLYQVEYKYGTKKKTKGMYPADKLRKLTLALIKRNDDYTADNGPEMFCEYTATRIMREVSHTISKHGKHLVCHDELITCINQKTWVVSVFTPGYQDINRRTKCTQFGEKIGIVNARKSVAKKYDEESTNYNYEECLVLGTYWLGDYSVHRANIGTFPEATGNDRTFMRIDLGAAFRGRSEGANGLFKDSIVEPTDYDNGKFVGRDHPQNLRETPRFAEALGKLETMKLPIIRNLVDKVLNEVKDGFFRVKDKDEFKRLSLLRWAEYMTSDEKDFEEHFGSVKFHSEKKITSGDVVEKMKRFLTNRLYRRRCECLKLAEKYKSVE